MKKTLFFAIALLIAGSLFAQRPNVKDWQNDIRAKKMEFVKQKLNLTEEEEKAFWPIYNEFEQKKWDLSQQKEKLRQCKKEGRTVDFNKINDMLINGDLMRAQLAKTYHEKFKKILPPEKLFKYYCSEREFKEKVLGEIKKKARDFKNK
jgi:hypothetical protein